MQSCNLLYHSKEEKLYFRMLYEKKLKKQAKEQLKAIAEAVCKEKMSNHA